MNKYEIMFIVKATIESDVVTKTADTFKSLFNDEESKVLEFKNMGERKFAYPIKKEINGYYFLMQVETTADLVKEFERKALIEENILRHLIIKLDEE